MAFRKTNPFSHYLKFRVKKEIKSFALSVDQCIFIYPDIYPMVGDLIYVKTGDQRRIARYKKQYIELPDGSVTPWFKILGVIEKDEPAQ